MPTPPEAFHAVFRRIGKVTDEPSRDELDERFAKAFGDIPRKAREFIAEYIISLTYEPTAAELDVMDDYILRRWPKYKDFKF